MNKCERARDAIELQWSPERASMIARRIRVRRQRRSVAKVALVCAAIAIAPLVLRPHPAPVVTMPDDSMTLAEGTEITPLDDTSAVTVERERIDDVAVTVRQGSAHFDVVHNPARAFTVHAGPVTVHVLGTQFRVERSSDAVAVTVEHGTVRVDGARASAYIVDGQTLTLPLHESAGHVPPVTERPHPKTALHVAATDDAVTELLANADHARTAGDFTHAARMLQAIANDHPTDDRAAMAAFIAGRVLLDNLDDACAATAAFAQVRTLAPHGPLARDALVREREAALGCPR